MTDTSIFAAWLRVPPARCWRLIATGPAVEVRRALDVAARAERLADTMVLPAGETPDVRRRDGR